MLAYTTSQPWVGPKPPGVRSFTRAEAAGMGQDKPFTVDLRRMAFVPVTREWFPLLNTADHGVVGRAPKQLRQELEATAMQIFSRHPQNVEQFGPLWPRQVSLAARTMKASPTTTRRCSHRVTWSPAG